MQSASTWKALVSGGLRSLATTSVLSSPANLFKEAANNFKVSYWDLRAFHSLPKPGRFAPGPTYQASMLVQHSNPVVKVRGYNVISPALFEIPDIDVSVDKAKSPAQSRAHALAYGVMSYKMTRSLQEARVPEKWARQRFYIKPKYRRAQKRWAGILKRKRRDFNYKLRWALKSMSRGL